MVLGVCQRVLHDPHDAEDAFQATFLVLARNAGSIAKRDSVGSWLYGVAHRTALKARAEAAKRRALERQSGDMANADPMAEIIWRDLRPVLDEELGRLPEKYRAPLVLCYLEGKTNEEAAQQLGWTKGTVSGRLARARDLLRTRLTRRGLALSTGVLVSALTAEAAPAAVPAGLIDSTVKAATLVVAGKVAIAGAVSASVAALAEGVLKAMLLTKLKMVLVVVLAMLVAGMGAGILTYGGLAGEEKKPNEEVAQASGKNAEPPRTGQDKIEGTWVVMAAEREGKRVSGEDLAPVDRQLIVRITADKVIFETPDGNTQSESRYKLDPAQKPKVIRLTLLTGEEKGKTVKGIYALEGKKLKLCLDARDGKEEPTEFESKAGSGLVVLELEPKTAAKEEKAVEAANKVRSQNNLRQIANAMHNYHGNNSHLPPAAVLSQDGKPLLSWRVLLLPYLEQDAVFGQFKLDEPWDSDHNKKLLATMPKVYAPPGVKTKEPFTTFYQAFTGKGTVFDNPKGNRFIDITDGTSFTILLAEAGEAVPWTKPEDLPYDKDKPLPKLGGLFPDGFHIALCDGSTRFVKKKFNETVMRLLIQRNDGQVVNPDELDR
jgi:RNA polymerase sigma-70 factor (ECF subfamily)